MRSAEDGKLKIFSKPNNMIAIILFFHYEAPFSLVRPDTWSGKMISSNNILCHCLSTEQTTATVFATMMSQMCSSNLPELHK